MNKNVKSFKQNSVSIGTVCGAKSYNKCLKCSLSALTPAYNHSFIAVSIICCSKSAQKFAVRVSPVATVVMETTQLVLSQLKKRFLLYKWRTE